MNPADLFRHDDHPVILAEGEELFHAGEAAQEMYALLEGKADIFVGFSRRQRDLARP